MGRAAPGAEGYQAAECGADGVKACVALKRAVTPETTWEKGESQHDLMAGHECIGKERVVRIEHFSRVARHHCFGGYMKVPKHLVRPPSAQQANDIRVNFCNKECRSTRSPQ